MRRDPEAQDLVPSNLLPAWERRDEARHVSRQHVAIRFRNSNLICDLMALSETGGNQAKAARLLGIKATTLNSKIKLFNIQIA